ncbi:hypothetical protein ACIHCQ_35745 [Streptomyces sp. NPDC052236]|uniref:hypothetical protein n=1 Tax=Streptomyces sp. NPDC052236 TaxID=3365686 RepID=UPI0037CF6D0D
MPETTVAAPFPRFTAHTVMAAFNYIRAVEAEDTAAAAEVTTQEPELPQMLLPLAERLIIPVTRQIYFETIDLCVSTLALDQLGGALLDTLAFWEGQAGPQVTEFLAHAVGSPSTCSSRMARASPTPWKP